MGIQARNARKFKVTTDSTHNEPIAPNLLTQDFSVDTPFEVWTSDLTYLRTALWKVFENPRYGMEYSRLTANKIHADIATT